MKTRIVTDYLDRAAEMFPDKLAFADEKEELSFQEVRIKAKRIGAAITGRGYFKRPVAVFLDKQAKCIPAFMGTVYSGNFYALLDTEMPVPRIEKIVSTLQPAAVITDYGHGEEAKKFCEEDKILFYEELEGNDRVCVQSGNVRGRIIDTDLACILFTSGSTGIPKGVALSHRAIVSYVEWGAETFGLNKDIILGNQTPFYFVMSIFDIYQTLRNGCTMYIIPKQLFSFPLKLLEHMRECKINTVCWVPSVLCLVANFGALPRLHLEDLRTVIFDGEPMPAKPFNMWRKEYPHVRFVQTYGQTEMTGMCVYYIVDRDFNDTDTIPIGKPCGPMDILVLDKEGKEVEGEEAGELCGRGPFLSSGYYNDFERTKENFVQNPLNHSYPETVYRTGDLVRHNERGELVFVSRKDFQIKHMGYRIEPGEIETAASAICGVEMSCCVYDDKKSHIILFYTGEITGKEVRGGLKAVLPAYMLPHKNIRLEKMPLNLSGKIDRKRIKEMIEWKNC